MPFFVVLRVGRSALPGPESLAYSFSASIAGLSVFASMVMFSVVPISEAFCKDHH